MLRLTKPLAAALVVLAVVAAAVLVHDAYFGPRRITAYFPSATSIYPDDEVRVAGIKIGHIAAIDADGDRVRMTLSVDRSVPIPADAKAVIVAANLISARYVELTPSYLPADEAAGRPKMADDAVIDIDRTAVPVEWDQVKEQLMRLATELGPNAQVSSPAIARFIDSAATALDGNGKKLRETLSQLAGMGRILAAGSGNIAVTIKNLQTFVSALQDTNPQIVVFQGRLATLTGVIAENRADLDAVLKTLAQALGDVQGFIADTRDETSEQVVRLADVTANLVEHRADVEQLLHVTPNAIANGYNDYNADTGTILGSVSFNNFSNPLTFICAAIGAVKNVTSEETAKLCAQYLGPALNQMTFNNLPFRLNPVLGPATTNLIYTDPALAPGGGGRATPVESPPSISAYTGDRGDQPPPPGWNNPTGPPGSAAPLPAYPSPAQYPGAPAPTMPGVENLLLPPGAVAPTEPAPEQGEAQP